MTRLEELHIGKTMFNLYNELNNVRGFYDNEYVIFGSTSLIMRGILDREPGDIDMFVSKRVWGKLLPRDGWNSETPKAGDPPILVNKTTPIMIHAFYDWSDPEVDMDVPHLLANPESIEYEGFLWNCIPVREALRHKEHAMAKGTIGVQKHIPDIELINEWLTNQPT